MTWRKLARAAVVVLVTVAAGLAGCAIIWPSSTIRYRMTVEVETPRGLKAGSSVIESTISDGPSIGDASGISYHYRGEGVAVDLPGGRTLFALMSGGKAGSDYHAYLLHDALEYGVPTPPLSRRYAAHEWLAERREAERVKPLIVVPRLVPFPMSKAGKADGYPRLVTFTDIRDPKSVQAVNPDDLAASFGPDVKLKRITVQITDDLVTTGIEKRLRWLGQYYAKMLDGSANNNSQALSNNLSKIDFTAGVRK
jgi:hypothetical protein